MMKSYRRPPTKLRKAGDSMVSRIKAGLFTNKRSALADDAGVTLIEIIVSVTMFTIMIFPILTAYNSLVHQNQTVKTSQAEIDYTQRIMEQFKENNADFLETDNNSATKAGYKKQDVGSGVVRYTLGGDDSIKLEQDIVDTAKTMYGVDSEEVKSLTDSNTSYKVVVTLDPTKYEVSGDGDSYVNPNDQVSYNLDNIDERYSVLIRDTASNYDERATTDLLNKAAEKLKDEDYKRYRLWQNGVNVFINDTFKKNTYIKIGYDNTNDTFVVNVTVNYYEERYGQSISYNIIKDKEYPADTTGNKAPNVYFFYNQFTQNSQTIEGTESVTIDNSEIAGLDYEKAAFNVYVIKSEENTNNIITSYKRTASGEVLPNGMATLNTAGSDVYLYKRGRTNCYIWPQFVYKVKQTDASTPVSADASEVKKVTKSIAGNVTPAVYANQQEGEDYYTYFVYGGEGASVTVPASVSGAKPDTSIYDMSQKQGTFSYTCVEETTLSGEEGDCKISVGDYIYVNQDGRYVLPNGDVMAENATPDSDDDNVACFHKTLISSYEDFGLNFLFAPGSSVGSTDNKLITIFTNMENEGATVQTGEKKKALSKTEYKVLNGISEDEINEEYAKYCASYYKEFFTSNSSGFEELRLVAVGNTTADSDIILSNFVTVKNIEEYVYPLISDAKDVDCRLYHITVKLLKKTADDEDWKTVCTLSSGKEV